VNIPTEADGFAAAKSLETGGCRELDDEQALIPCHYQFLMFKQRSSLYSITCEQGR